MPAIEIKINCEFFDSIIEHYLSPGEKGVVAPQNKSYPGCRSPSKTKF